MSEPLDPGTLSGPALREALAEALGWRRVPDWPTMWVHPNHETSAAAIHESRLPAFETWAGMEATLAACRESGFSVALAQHRDGDGWVRLQRAGIVSPSPEGPVAALMALFGASLPEALARALLLALTARKGVER